MCFWTLPGKSNRFHLFSPELTWGGNSSGSSLSTPLSLCSSLDNQLVLFWRNQLLWIVFLVLQFDFVSLVVIHIAAAGVAFVITAVNIAWSNELLIAEPLKSRHGLLTASSTHGRLSGTAGTWCQINHALEACIRRWFWKWGSRSSVENIPQTNAFLPLAERSPLKCQPIAVFTWQVEVLPAHVSPGVGNIFLS